MKRYLAAGLASTAVAALLLSAAAASADDDWRGKRLNVPADQWLSPSAVIDKLTAEGYKVRKIESDDGAYEVEMTDANGVRIETYVHPATGKLMPGYDD